MRPLAPTLRAYRGEKKKSIDQLFFPFNDFHDDFLQTLNRTNLFRLIKAKSILHHGVQWQQPAAMQIPLKPNVLHINIIWYDETICYCCWPHFPGKPTRGYRQYLGLAGEITGLGISVMAHHYSASSCVYQLSVSLNQSSSDHSTYQKLSFGTFLTPRV